MTFYVTNQKTVVLVLFLFGAVSGILRDTVIAKRRVVHTGKIAEFFEDLLLCLALTLAYHIIAFITNYGYVRWYGIASVLAGFYLYRVTLSPLILRIATAVVRLIVLILGILVYPMRILFGLLKKCFAAVRRTIAAGILILGSQRKKKRLLRLSSGGFRILR